MLSVLASIAVSAVVIVLTTWRPWLTVLAVLCISWAICCITAFVLLLGWTINVFEATVIVLTIGLSFDYTLHIAVAYKSAPDFVVKEKVVYAIETVGAPVFMSAATNFLAGLALVCLRFSGGMVEVGGFNERNLPISNGAIERDEKSSTSEEKPLLDRDSFHTEFDTNAYLKDFYTNIDDPAMQMVLTFLPHIVARLPPQKTLLDFGAGPTIHVAVCFRNLVEHIYLADYLPQNREELCRWKSCQSTFDWSSPLKMIATHEGKNWTNLKKLEVETREKVSKILYCNAFENPAVQGPEHVVASFDIVNTIFTLEYCCNTLEEYQKAVKNVIDLVKPGGYFIMGGILEETWCSFGGRKFKCLYITKEFIFGCFRDAGLLVDEDKLCRYLEINGMFMICARKKGD
uniref:Uncharacterized protein n=1 Tax=Acrobeloides nanus TaxID=290746 RepID=A0A914DM78_9BILA